MPRNQFTVETVNLAQKSGVALFALHFKVPCVYLILCNINFSEFIPCIFSSGIKEDKISTINILLSTLKTKVRVCCLVCLVVFEDE